MDLFQLSDLTDPDEKVAVCTKALEIFMDKQGRGESDMYLCSCTVVEKLVQGELR